MVLGHICIKLPRESDQPQTPWGPRLTKHHMIKNDQASARFGSTYTKMTGPERTVLKMLKKPGFREGHLSILVSQLVAIDHNSLSTS